MGVAESEREALSEKDTILLANRPTAFILVVIFAGFLASAYHLRANGIFACQADGYAVDSYLAYCNGADFGDYEHGAFWFDLEPTVKPFVTSAAVLFLGDSYNQFAFSTDATRRWFSAAASTYYLLGFVFGENVTFEEKILLKLKPQAKVYVIPVDFFERSVTVPAKKVMYDPASRYEYERKYYWQLLHRHICENASFACGNRTATFRSRKTGEYRRSGRERGLLEGTPVRYDHDINQEKIKQYSTSAKAFLSDLHVNRDCVILTTIPSVREHAFVYIPSIETANAVAKEVGVSFVAPEFDGLRTSDGAHLDQSSAERWSDAFFRMAGLQMSGCLKRS